MATKLAAYQEGLSSMSEWVIIHSFPNSILSTWKLLQRENEKHIIALLANLQMHGWRWPTFICWEPSLNERNKGTHHIVTYWNDVYFVSFSKHHAECLRNLRQMNVRECVIIKFKPRFHSYKSISLHSVTGLHQADHIPGLIWGTIRVFNRRN
jgi:hypothetical protein